MNNHTFDRSKWQQMSIFAQMGNIGSEVGRSAKAFAAQDNTSFEGAFKRALDLFDATIEGLATKRSPRLKEVLYARDQFVSQYFNQKPKVDAGLESYFMQFAIADRLKR